MNLFVFYFKKDCAYTLDFRSSEIKLNHLKLILDLNVKKLDIFIADSGETNARHTGYCLGHKYPQGIGYKRLLQSKW